MALGAWGCGYARLYIDPGTSSPITISQRLLPLAWGCPFRQGNDTGDLDQG